MAAPEWYPGLAGCADAADLKDGAPGGGCLNDCAAGGDAGAAGLVRRVGGGGKAPALRADGRAGVCCALLVSSGTAGAGR
ncbi:MAG TPA: hypothetical protein VHD63_28635 [Ktedonobacteraceae bacterium]|nr:hypothetical protein [Ktedonobacteraceae bacterium]